MDLYTVDKMNAIRFLRTVKTIKKIKNQDYILGCMQVRTANMERKDLDKFLANFGFKEGTGTNAKLMALAEKDTDLAALKKMKDSK